MIADAIKDIINAVITLLSIPITIDGFTFSLYSIFIGIAGISIAILVLGKFIGGDE